MSTTGTISLFCLVLTAVMAVWGVFSKHFDDSLMQRVGLAGLAFASLMRIPEKLANPLAFTPPEVLIAQIALCIFGVGTIAKLWLAGRHKPFRRHRGYTVHL